IAAFLAVLAVGIGAYLVFQSLNKDEPVTKFALDDYVGMTLEEASQRLLDLDLVPKGVKREDTNQAPGLVFETDPKAGVIITKGMTITLYYRPEDELRAVPDVRNKTLAEAKELLLVAGFEVADPVNEVVDPSVPVGSVISQDPAPKAMEKQGTAITLTVSQGPGKVTIPNVAEQMADAATDVLRSAAFNFSVNRVQESNDAVPAGRVIRTD
ncbi:MAG TPA: PASTA domain-containing protein, partial [Ilumatobacteraceae bacterium]|nr:PASTA domain-containing protein [Ilumatobacteraceae bacterium]